MTLQQNLKRAIVQWLLLSWYECNLYTIVTYWAIIYWNNEGVAALKGLHQDETKWWPLWIYGGSFQIE